MAIEIYKQEVNEEKPTKIALVNESGRIYLAVVGDNGEVATSGYIAIVSEKGLKLCESFDGNEYGIAIEAWGSSDYIAVEKE